MDNNEKRDIEQRTRHTGRQNVLDDYHKILKEQTFDLHSKMKTSLSDVETGFTIWRIWFSENIVWYEPEQHQQVLRWYTQLKLWHTGSTALGASRRSTCGQRFSRMLEATSMMGDDISNTQQAVSGSWDRRWSVLCTEGISEFPWTEAKHVVR